ncbi:hypothetical protein [Pseudomonas gessardii]|uniref:hypothetical protein n=1 Tax=Pseudomonas gessardii TaxID=78544 RepID=UPI0021CCF9A7|nr:hypothetical protein [Pseudomonas gessardii]
MEILFIDQRLQAQFDGQFVIVKAMPLDKIPMPAKIEHHHERPLQGQGAGVRVMGAGTTYITAIQRTRDGHGDYS